MGSHQALAPRMVGRQVQLNDLDAHWYSACGGAGRVVFIVGEAGVGKTCLSRTFVNRVRMSTASDVLQGQCHEEDSAIPYGPFIEVVRAGMRVHGAEAVVQAAGPLACDLVSLLPELEPLAPPPPSHRAPQSQKRRLFEAIYRAIRPYGERHCRLLVLEDLHWADQTSQELLRYLARTSQNDRLLILGTYRSDELHRHHPLTLVIAQLTRERLSHEVRLAPLSRDVLARMLETTLERPLPVSVVDILHDRTGGNPFFVEELLKGLIEQDQLEAFIQSARQGKGLAHIEIPLSLKESILSRTADLDETTAAVLTYAAVIGRRFDFELLLRLTGLEEAALVRAVEVLVVRQLVVEDTSGPEDRYSFRHALTREAVYDDLLGRQRRLKHRAVLQALEEAHQSRAAGIVDQLAYHSLQAREVEKAAHYARLAGERAARLSAHREAVAHYEVVLELLEQDDLRAQADLYDTLAKSAYPLGDTDLFLRYWQEALRLYQQLGDQRKVSDIYRWLGRVSWQRGDSRAAFELTRAAVSALEAAPPGRELAMAYSALSWIHMLSTRSSESIEWGEKALRLAGELDDEAVTAHALNNVGVSLVELGACQRGLAYLERGLEVAKRIGLWVEALRTYNNLGEILALLGEFERAAGVLREGIALADQLHWELPGVMHNELAEVETALGHWEQAHEELDRAIVAGEMGFPIARLAALPNKGELLLRQGRLDEAQRSLEAILPACERQGEFQFLHGLWSALARLHVARGDVDQAVAVMERGVALWRAIGPAVRATSLLGFGVEVYLAAGRHDRVQELLEGLAALANGPATPLALARFADAQGLIAAQQGRHAEAAAHFQQAVERWRAMACPFEEARARRRRAESLLHAGDPPARAEAGGELTAARETFARLGAPLELAVVDAALKQHGLVARPARAGAGRTGTLTPREREVLTLIARGCSNREIAANLVISEKTAEIHTGNILAKLGCASRTQAVAAAVAQGLVDRPDA